MKTRVTAAASCVLAFLVLNASGANDYEFYYLGTLAGSSNYGSADGAGSAARFFQPEGVAVDSAGNRYIADTQNHTIRKLTPAGVVSTWVGSPGASGSDDGVGSAARFDQPVGLSFSVAGDLYVADSNNHTIRKISPAGAVTTVAGLAGVTGSADGTGAAARFNLPSFVAADAAGNIYISDSANHTIRKMDSAGAVTTFAGLAGSRGSADGTGSAARFDFPTGLAVDNAGFIYVGDQGNHTIRKITSAAAVSTLAGLAGSHGSLDGVGSGARFYSPRGVSVNGSGTLAVADRDNQTIRSITSSGTVSTLAGRAGMIGADDGLGFNARFDSPGAVAFDSSGNITVVERLNSIVRKVTPDGMVTTAAGRVGFGSADGGPGDARFYNPGAIAFDAAGAAYVADTSNFTVRKVTLAGDVITIAGLAGASGSVDGYGSAARFSSARGIAAAPDGSLYVADTDNHTIRKIAPDGYVSTFAGTPNLPGSSNGTGTAARFRFPFGVAVDAGGDIFVADSENHTIRRITPSGTVTTFAGAPGLSGYNDGNGAAARFNHPTHISFDSTGNLYVADTYAYTVRRITPAGDVTTLAGSPGNPGSDDGVGSMARFNFPFGLTVDSSGNVYVSDQFNQLIRKIRPSGMVTTLAGTLQRFGFADGLGSQARISFPEGLAARDGKLYLVDRFNHSLRVLLFTRKAALPKTHGSVGVFARELAVIGRATVESRRDAVSGGDHSLILAMARSLATAGAVVTTGGGSVSAPPVISGDTLTLNLTGVPDASTVTITLNGMTDTSGRVVPDTTFLVSFLLGDTNGDGIVNAGDVTQTRSRAGGEVDGTSYVSDVNVDGALNSADVTIVRGRSGNFLP